MRALGSVFGVATTKACSVIRRRLPVNVINAFHVPSNTEFLLCRREEGGLVRGRSYLQTHGIRHNSLLSGCFLLRTITFLRTGLKSEVAFCNILELPKARNCGTREINRSGK